MKTWVNKRIFAWSLYDFADTSFSALFITFFYPILVRNVLGGTEFQVGLSLGLSLLATALVVPFVGALSDAMGRRIPILAVSTLITVGLTAATGYAGLAAALVLGFLANLFNTLDIDLYDSFIPELVPPEKRGRLSGLGTGVGYLGTIASLAMAYGILAYFGFESEEGIRAIFPAVAVFYFIFSLPLFLTVPDIKRIRRPLGESARVAIGQLKHTLTHLGEYRGLGPFLLASFIYNDAMHTAIIFLSLYGTDQIGLTVQQFFFAFALIALAAFAGSFLFGKLSDRLRPRRVLTVILVLWMLVIGLLIFTKSWQIFVLAGSLGGALLGGVWTCNRHMIAMLAPPHKVAEIYGIEGLTEKTAGVIGPIGFGWLATNYGYPPGLVFLMCLFVIGIFVLRKYVPKEL